MSEITKAALQASVKAGEPIIKQLDEMTKEPMRTQREFLLFLQPETYLLYRDLMLMKGYSVGQLKPVNVISNYTRQKFFFGLQDDFDKLKKITSTKENKK